MATTSTQARDPAPSAPRRAPTRHATARRIVSFDRPYAEDNGAEDFLTEELPLVEFAEEHGLDVTYTTDVAVSEQPSLLLGHRAILSLAHDETWTYPELAGVQAAVGKGENVAFFSAAAIVRHARLQASPLGPDREVVDYRDPDEDPLNGKASPDEVTGNTWDQPPTDYSVTALVGELYSGYLDPGHAVPFVVTDASSWLFAGTGLHDGSQIPEVIASDIDHVSPSYPMPSDLEVLGHSPVPLSEAVYGRGRVGRLHVLRHDLLHRSDVRGRGLRFGHGELDHDARMSAR